MLEKNIYITYNISVCYYPLIWMFHSRKLSNHINQLQERPIGLAYKDNEAIFDDLLRARSLVVTNLQSETKGCRFEPGC